MKLLELEHNKTYIIGVSGGPDSMALLDMCVKAKLNIVIAHMNYQVRKSAFRDMEIVEQYAKQYHIPCEIRLQEKPCKGNFEAFAREQRYAFYAELMHRYHGEGVLLAHHLDDHLETYLMQKQRNSEGSVWGIREQTVIHGCNILRPLLSYTKNDIMDYCEKFKVPYGIDETNLGNDYTRNRIRHEIIEPMSREEKEALATLILQENEQKATKTRKWKQYLSTWQHTVEELSLLEEEDLKELLQVLIYEQLKLSLNHHEINMLVKLIRKHEDGWSRVIANKYEFYQEYGKLCIDFIKEQTFFYTYDRIRFEQTPYFTISDHGSSTEALTLQEDDFPITIRNAQAGDVIQLRFGRKKLNRWFIDRKIPKKERKIWPVVTNKDGIVILVPKIGCDIAHFSNNPTLFVLK